MPLRMLSRFKLESLKSRLLGTFVLVSVLPLGGVGILVDRQGGATLRSEIVNHLEGVAESKGQQIERWVEERRNDLTGLASIPVFQRQVTAFLERAADPQKRPAYHELRQTLDQGIVWAFSEMFLLDPTEGQVLISTDPEQEGKFKKDRPYFREGLRGPYIEHVYYSLARGKAVMAFSVAVSDSQGRLMAILVGRLDLGFLDRLMAERAGLGTSGRTFLVNRFNYFVSESLGRGEHGWRPVFSEGVTLALAGGNGSRLYLNHEKRAVVGAYRWLPELGLALIAEMDQEEAFTPIRTFRIVLVTVLGLVGGGAVLLGIGFSYGISRPVNRLVSAVRAIGGGDLAHRVEVRRPGELAALAAAVNRMADDLLSSRREVETYSRTLERRVEERTAESEARRRTAEILAEAGRAFVRGLGIEEVAQRVVDSVRVVLHGQGSGLYRVDPESGALTALAVSGHVGRAFGRNLAVPPGTGVIGLAAQERCAVTTSDALANGRFRFDADLRAALEQEPNRAVVATPMIVQERTIGVLIVVDRVGRVFSEEEARLAQALADDAALAMENARLYEEIKSSRDFLQSIMDASVDAIATTDVHGRITYLSPGGEATFGYRSEEILGQRVRDYYRSGPSEARAIMRRLTAEGRIRNYETGFRAVDGRWVEVNASLSILRDASGASVGTLGVIRDMTESRRAEDVLSKLSSAVEHAGDAVFVTDRAGVIEYVNPAFENLTGYTSEEAVGQTPRILKSGTHPPGHYEDLWRRILAGDTVRRVFINRKKDGALYDEEKMIAPILDRGGGITHFVSTGRDITERRRAEERQATRFAVTRVLAECATLDEAASRLLEALGEGMRWEVGELWRPDSRASFLRCEEFWHAPSLEGAGLEGLRRHATVATGQGLPGRVWLSRAAAWVPDIAADPDCLEEAAVARAGLHAAFAFPIRTDTRVAGVLVFFGRESRPRDDALLEMAAEFDSHLGQFVARELAQQTLREREEQLRQSQKMEAVGTLAGGIAHDFNNLMTVITGRAQLLTRDAGATEPARRDLELIRQTAVRAARLVKLLLAFSRRQVLEPKVLDLNSVVEGTRPMLERLIREDIELVAVLRPVWRVEVDPGQIEQVIVNLVVNARDAMPEGGRLTMETANVELDHEGADPRAGVEPGEYVVLSVSDTGRGMDAETQSRMFEPFFTTKAPGEGTGLGLSTVYGIVKQSGGSILVESEPGRGTTFGIYLPRVDRPLDALGSAQPPAEALGGVETILLVEDDADVRTLAREVLQFHGYMVLEANDVSEALAISEHHPATIDVLVTDVVMPKMNGPALAQRLMPARPGMKVLYMSGYTGTVGHEGMLEDGPSFLQKPFTPDALAAAVRRVVDDPGGRGTP